MTENIDKKTILSDAIAGRKREIMMYQINIDNYDLMLNSGADDDAEIASDMADYRKRIKDLLRSERVEQAKSKMVLSALEAQLAAIKE